MQKRNLYIYAPNIHIGGGKVLLDRLLKLDFNKINVILLIDQRYELESNTTNFFSIKRFKNNFLSRLMMECWLKIKLKKGDTLLCFSNLPPLFKTQAKVIVFNHNRFTVDSVSLKGFTLKSKIKLYIQRIWFKKRSFLVNSFIVQTNSMKDLISNIFPNSDAIHIIPFVGHYEEQSKNDVDKEFDKISDLSFTYIATGEPHKNHKNLIKAWSMMANNNFYPKLYLTVDENSFRKIHELIQESIVNHKTRIINLGYISHDEVLKIYEKADALIFPSFIESFGLPLLEAKSKNLTIVAAELDYVRDIIDPDQTFNPSSPVSIIKAVERVVDQSPNIQPFFSAQNFLEHILESK